MRGHTLVELTFVLLLVGVAAASVAPTARQARDRAAVAGAREAVVALLAEARQAAIETGGAAVWLFEDGGLAELSVAAERLRRVSLSSDFGVTLELSGARSDVELRYDAVGLGRMASQTVVFRRGDAAAELVVSSYGRVRRR
jgi:type II secretory pathway pseudopilin PulG